MPTHSFSLPILLHFSKNFVYPAGKNNELFLLDCVIGKTDIILYLGNMEVESSGYCSDLLTNPSASTLRFFPLSSTHKVISYNHVDLIKAVAALSHSFFPHPDCPPS